jgi:Na+-translocating ferredoxin:NAD+ oxidoreductase RnfE subunit
MLVILGATVLINGLTHLITSISIWSYGPGLYTSIFIWIPLGLVTLIRAKSIVSKRNYWMAIAIGIGINVVIGVLTMRGARLV